MEPQLLTVIDKSKLMQWAPSEWLNWQFEAKHDGARCLIVDGVPQSRTGKPLYHMELILKEMGPRALKGVVFDGEVTGSNWADTMHNVRAAKSNRELGALTFRPFDMLTLPEWKAQSCPRGLHDRQQLLFMRLKESEHVQRVSSILIDNYEEFERFYKLCIEAGGDGVVLKLLHSLYEFKRVKSWLKVKPELTVDGKVVGLRVGKLRYAGTLGALEFEYNGVITNVSGMTDDQRHRWWNYRDQKAWSDNPGYKIVGKTIEVKCRGIHPTGKLIEPRFVRIREDK